MAGEISVQPEAQTQSARSLGSTLDVTKSGLSTSFPPGMQGAHLAAVTAHTEAGRNLLSTAQGNTEWGANRATALGDVDKQNATEYDKLKDAKDGTGKDGKDGKDAAASRADRPGRLTGSDLNKFLASSANGQGATSPYQSSMPTQQTAPPVSPMSAMSPVMSAMPQAAQQGLQGLQGMNPTQAFLNSPAGAEVLKSLISSGAASKDADWGPASLKMGEGSSDKSKDGKLRALAQQLVNAHIPYAWGGGGLDGPTRGTSDGGGAADAHGDYRKKGFDCSGLARYVHYQLTGVQIPRTSEAQFSTAMQRGWAFSDASRLRPGDLVFPNYSMHSSGPGHVQVYIGNGHVLEAPSSGQYVKVSNLPAGKFARFPNPYSHG